MKSRRETMRTPRDVFIRVDAIAPQDGGLVGFAFLDSIEQPVIRKIEFVWKPDVAHRENSFASARPMIVRWISLVPS
jgi:hypothetical protein